MTMAPPSNGPALPVETIHAAFGDAFRAGHLVISAPTGSGKSTMVPGWCLEALGTRGRVLVVEPRRVACRALARYVSERFDGAVGETVGYRVQHDDCSGPETRILFATPGVALRLLQGEGCRQWPVAILDEFHERGLETDLLLAICRHERVERILVMSATLEKKRLTAYLDGQLLEASGRLHPVELDYESDSDLPSPANLEERVARAVTGFDGREEGDLLVFLPGKAEISACLSRLTRTHGVEALPLHGGLPPAEQDRVFRPGPADRRRVILSTNVAETSVTIPGVVGVIDAGLARQTYYRDGRTVLGLRVISKASAEQRRGRAGRLRPGRCLRLWGRQAVLQPDTPPEILRQDLSQAVLTAAAAGYRLADLPMLDTPRSFAVDQAAERLAAVGALDDTGITGLGRAMFGLPLDVSFSRVLLEARKTEQYPGHVLQALVDLTALLNLDRPLFAPPPPGDAGEEVAEERRKLGLAGCDAAKLVRALRSDRANDLALNRAVAAEARKVAAQVRALLKIDAPDNKERDRVDSRGMALAWIRAVPGSAFVPRARREAWGSDAGEEVVLSRDSVLKTGGQALVAAARRTVVGKSGRKTTFTTCALPADLALLTEAGLGTESVKRVFIDRGRVMAEVERRYAGALLDSREEEPAGPAARTAVAQLILRNRLLKGAGDALREAVERHNLRCRLEPAEGREPTEPEEWLTARLAEAGLEHGSDTAMLTVSDLAFPDPPDEEREAFDRKFPRRLSLGNLKCRVEYEPAGRLVTLVKESGLSTQPPDPRYLPAWPGWKIRFRDRQRVIPVRG
jgi:ATP-dependent helicase HrpB